MTLAELRLEVRSRLNGPGYRFLSDDRVDRFVNQARAELDRMHLWPYREASATGTAPLTITDLGEIETVENTTRTVPLMALDFRTLLDIYGDLSTSGTPLYYYTATPSSPEVAVFPTSSTDTIGVQYWKVCVDLTADSDEPEAPADFHGLIADMATAHALRAQRLFNEAEAYQPAIDRQLQQMVNSYPPGIADYTGTFVTSEQDY